MVNFGQQLLASQDAQWKDYYIDYDLLKKIIDDEYHVKTVEFGSPSRTSQRSVASTASWRSSRSYANSRFLSALHLQAEKVSFFVLQQVGSITAELWTCRRQQQLLLDTSDNNYNTNNFGDGFDANSDLEAVQELEDMYVEVGLKLLKLIRFVECNITGFRKILKKHDKVARTKLSLTYLSTAGSPFGSSRRSSASSYLSLQRLHDDPQLSMALGNQLLQPLLKEDTIAALAGALEFGVEELRRYRFENDNYYNNDNNNYSNNNNKLDKGSRSITAPDLLLIAGMAQEHNATLIVKQPMANRNSHGDMRSILTSERADASPPPNKTSPGQVVLQIHAARGRLYNTSEFIRLLAAPMMTDVIDEIMDDDYEAANEEASVQMMHHRRPSSISNFLNLLSTFLYMTNYYIVAPTSATYADKVGSDSSMASIIIGMTSVAALVSTLLYSWWTSYSYKAALIFASTCSVVGNLFYAAGLPCHSLTLVMIGRLLNGFGSARSINRRYVADSYPPAERTAASAAFVTATALGMATGPALASVLHMVAENSKSDYWQPENAPGWFMFTMWVVFLVLLIWKFEDPPRLKKMMTANNIQQQLVGTTNEKKPLLGINGYAPPLLDDAPPAAPLCCNIPVLITLVIYMVLKMVLEAVLSSESNLTSMYFGWHGNIMGIHLTILALLILPVNYGIAFLARWYFDRELIIGLLVAMLGGCFIIYQYQSDTADYTLWQYLIGSAVLFVCASALEAPNMSLLSKVIPMHWRTGIVNVGLLATESGTFGRVVGDCILAAMARHGKETFLDEAFGTFGAIILANLMACLLLYRHLEPVEKDD